MATTIPLIKAGELQEDQRARGVFLVRRKVRGTGKTGRPWLQLLLGDTTGTIDGRVWDNAEQIDQDIQENDIVEVEGQGVRYMNQIQFKVFRARKIDDPALRAEDFLPSSSRSAAELAAETRARFARLRSEPLRRLVAAYLDDADWWLRFATAPAAKSVHHAYRGGLAEHTLSMLDLARSIGEHYIARGVEPLSLDILLVGTFLHDTGKVDELSAQGAFEYTDEGRLIGHLVLGLDELDRKISVAAPFPAELRLHLRHLILSHHGEYEYGSPRRPKTIEAMILHFIDNLDARVEICRAAIASAQNASGHWTGYEPTLDRFIYRRPLGDDVPPD